jgi:hypothetical protein
MPPFSGILGLSKAGMVTFLASHVFERFPSAFITLSFWMWPATCILVTEGERLAL